MNGTTGVLSEQEVNRVVQNYLRNGAGSLKEAEEIVGVLSFYAECGMIAEGILSGDFEVTGVGESGLQYRLSDKARKRLH